MATDSVCISCRKPASKGSKSCGLCEEPVCKDCVQFLEASTFSFLSELPPELSHTYYCSNCYGTTVEPALTTYEETMVQARDVFIFFTTQKRAPTVIKKAIAPVRVDSCDDRDETILRMAFLAAQQGHNALLNTEVEVKKVRNAGYQKSDWRGVGTPATVDASKVERDAERDEW